jgi:hypothetical protein
MDVYRAERSQPVGQGKRPAKAAQIGETEKDPAKRHGTRALSAGCQQYGVKSVHSGRPSSSALRRKPALILELGLFVHSRHGLDKLGSLVRAQYRPPGKALETGLFLIPGVGREPCDPLDVSKMSATDR